MAKEGRQKKSDKNCPLLYQRGAPWMVGGGPVGVERGLREWKAIVAAVAPPPGCPVSSPTSTEDIVIDVAVRATSVAPRKRL